MHEQTDSPRQRRQNRNRHHGDCQRPSQCQRCGAHRHLSRHLMSIERSTGWVGRTPVTGQPKTQSGTRSVTLPPFALELLRRWKPSQTRLQLAQGVDWRGDGRIITMPNGTMPAPWVCRNALERSRKALGLPHIRQHDMRHLHASLLLAEGSRSPSYQRGSGTGHRQSRQLSTAMPCGVTTARQLLRLRQRCGWRGGRSSRRHSGDGRVRRKLGGGRVGAGRRLGGCDLSLWGRDLGAETRS